MHKLVGQGTKWWDRVAKQVRLRDFVRILHHHGHFRIYLVTTCKSNSLHRALIGTIILTTKNTTPSHDFLPCPTRTQSQPHFEP